MHSHVARQMWARFEPIHDVTYFSPEALAAYQEVGLRGYWRGYFGGRMAPLGPVDAPVAIATAYGFAPAMVERALPDIWTRAAPETALAARAAGATAALIRMSSDLVLSDLDETVELAEAAADLLDPAGRPLGAANMALPRTAAHPLTRLWQVATTMREHRGDGHVAALVANGFSGIESAVWRTEPEFRAEFQSYRGWTDEEWDAAVADLTKRGWLTDGVPTEAGAAMYTRVEDATDRAALHPWERVRRGAHRSG